MGNKGSFQNDKKMTKQNELLDIKNQSPPLGGTASSKEQESAFSSSNSSPGSPTPSSAEGLIGSSSPPSSSSVNQPSPLESSSSVNQPSPLTSFSVNQPSPSRGEIPPFGDLEFLLQKGQKEAIPDLLRTAIYEEMKSLISREGWDHRGIDIRAAAERVHAKSDNIDFLKKQYTDLAVNGTASEAFKYGVGDLANENLVAEILAAMHFSESPWDPFWINLIITLGLFLFPVFLGMRQVWKNWYESASKKRSSGQ